MRASGFAPNEEVRLHTHSGEIKIWDNVSADEKGVIYYKLMHQTFDDTGGMAVMELEGSRGKVTMNYPWGTSYKRELL